MSVVGLHDIQNVAGEVLLWAIVVGDSDSARGLARVDTVATVLYRAQLGASNGRGVGARWGLVLWASWTILVQTSWGVAVLILSSAVLGLLVMYLALGTDINSHPAPEQHCPAAQEPIPAPHCRSS